MHKKMAVRSNRGQIEHSLGRAAVFVLGALAAWLAPAAAAAADGAADTGSTAWVLSATALVLFMTLPGLALFYGGLVRARNVLSVLMHCVSIACIVSLLWAVAGYTLAFGEGAIIGGLGNVFLAGLAPVRSGTVLPEAAFVAFQMTFAIITPALVIGAFPERVTFPFVVGFAALWLALVYVPAAHWVWGGGFLAALGVLDFAGGIVVHTTAGVSALVAALVVGPRRGFPRSLVPPHSPGMTMAGAGMLWVGWFGFNGGSALAADGVAANAILVTHLAAATAAIVWTAVEWIKIGKPTSVGIVTGVIAGLATITPASGYVGPAGAIAIGAAAGALCFAAVLVVKQRFLIDDSLDVFAVHGVGGMLGSLLLALFATSALGGAGLAEGRSWAGQLGIQAVGVIVVAAWSAAATFGILKLLDALVGLRVGAEEEHDGLDLAAHGERAYDFT
jgi:Amt family ammonium transporter